MHIYNGINSLYICCLLIIWIYKDNIECYKMDIVDFKIINVYFCWSPHFRPITVEKCTHTSENCFVNSDNYIPINYSLKYNPPNISRTTGYSSSIRISSTVNYLRVRMNGSRACKYLNSLKRIKQFQKTISLLMQTKGDYGSLNNLVLFMYIPNSSNSVSPITYSSYLEPVRKLIVLYICKTIQFAFKLQQCERKSLFSVSSCCVFSPPLFVLKN